MFQIIGKQNLNKLVRRVDVRAEALVAKMRPGQFVSVMPDRFSRLVPMNVYEVDFRRRCVSLVFEEHDEETVKLGKMRINDHLFAVNGPYGQGIEVEKLGTVLFIGEGFEIASIAMLCRYFKQAGNKVIGFAGFEGRDSSVLENQLRLNCTKFYVMYKDGTHERRGDVLAPFKKIMSGDKSARIYAHASLNTMKEIRDMAVENNIPLVINIMGLLDQRPSFSDMDTLLVNGEIYSPARDGVWMDVSQMDLELFVRETQALKEYFTCRKNEVALLASKNGWARLKKFIWG